MDVDSFGESPTVLARILERHCALVLDIARDCDSEQHPTRVLTTIQNFFGLRPMATNCFTKCGRIRTLPAYYEQ